MSEESPNVQLSYIWWEVAECSLEPDCQVSILAMLLTSVWAWAGYLNSVPQFKVGRLSSHQVTVRIK